MPQKSLSQHLRDFLSSNPPLPMLVRELVTFVDLYHHAARRLSSVHEAQLTGRNFRDTWEPAHQSWVDMKRDVLLIGEQLARAMTLHRRKTKRLLKLLNTISLDGERSGWPGGVDLVGWSETKAWFQQLALQAEAAGSGSDPAGGDQASKDDTPCTRGRRRRYDPRKDVELALAWKRARDTGVCKKDFAKDEGLSLKGFDQLLNRVRKQNNRRGPTCQALN